MKRHGLALVVIGLLALISEKVQCAKYGRSTSSVYQDGDQETTSSVPSVVVSSSSTNKRKGGSYASHNYGNSNYYDYTPSLEFAPVESPYYSKYYSDPLPAYTRQQRYVHPEYLNDGVVSAQSNSLAYSLPQSFAIADSSGEPYASASHSGGHSHSHGHMHGHGHGHKQPHYQISAVNTDAIGLLGLLGLLGILQAVLLLLTTTTTAAAATGKRKKRDLDAEELEEYEKRHMTVEKLTKLVLPSLNVVAQARIGKISVNCTQREVCKTNKFLVENMGPDGKVASYRLTDAMEKMICAFDQSEHLKASIKRAGHLGRSSADCEKLYPICKDLRSGGVYSVPVLLPPSHPLYYDNVKAGKMGK